jgi:hypothetical protein
VGLLKGRLGEAAVASVLEGMIPIKKVKVDDACATVKPSKYDVSERNVAKKMAKPAPAQKSNQVNPDNRVLNDDESPPKGSQMGGSGDTIMEFTSEPPKKKVMAKKPELGKKPALSSIPPKPVAAAPAKAPAGKASGPP